MALFRDGNDDAFRVIHDRYRQRLFAYMRQMLAGSRQDAEDALQDVFIRAYGSLRTSSRPVTLRAWLYRVAHNRCIDQLRRPVLAPAELLEASRTPLRDPLIETERREDLRRLVSDVRRLPDQQRSALLMRELQGMSYADLAVALDTSVPAVKSLLVRARMGLVEAAEARDTRCVEIRDDLVLAFDRGVRMSGRVRRHVRECAGCSDFRAELRGVRRQFSLMVPAGAGPCGLLAKLGIGGSAAGSGALGGGGAVTLGGGAATATKLALVCCAAVFTAGGALEAQGQHAAPAGGARARPPSARIVAAISAGSPGTTVAQQDVLAIASSTRHAVSAEAALPVIDPDAALFAQSATPAPVSVSGSGGVAAPPGSDTSASDTGSTPGDSAAGSGKPGATAGADHHGTGGDTSAGSDSSAGSAPTASAAGSGSAASSASPGSATPAAGSSPGSATATRPSGSGGPASAPASGPPGSVPAAR